MLELIRNRTRRPRRTVIYGVHGVGKTTWAARWPSPVFVMTEDGAGDVDCIRTPLCTSYAMVREYVKQLSEAEEFKTIVIDSADWLERLIWDAVCMEDGKQDITAFGYGKGYERAGEELASFLRLLSSAHDKGKHVILIAHAVIKRFENPEGDAYDRYQPKLHQKAGDILQEWADEVLFASFESMIKRAKGKTGDDKAVAIGSDKRWLYCNHRPARAAKNRLGITEERLEFGDYLKRVSEYYKETKV